MYECNKAWEWEKTKQNLPFFVLKTMTFSYIQSRDKEE